MAGETTWVRPALPVLSVMIDVEVECCVVCVQVRNFSAVVLTANNMFSREVGVFRSARLFFSVGGLRYQSAPVVYETSRDELDETMRQVVIPVAPGRLARQVRLILSFDLRWILVSEVRFVNGIAAATNCWLTMAKRIGLRLHGRC